MGAGGVVEDKVDGLIVDPHDEEGFAAAIRTMVADHGLRSKMAAAARDKAFRYTWSVVGGRRRDALLGRINALRTDSRDDGGAPHVS
jgi:glycosyltransferase involved in cell wall biosynthesis